MRKMKSIYNSNRAFWCSFLFTVLFLLLAIKTDAQVIEGSSDVIKFSVDKGENERQKDIFDNPEDIKYYAILIGINNYEDPAIPQLFEPIHDASNLYDILTRTYTFDIRNTMLLKNPTREQIINSFDSLSKVISPFDNLFIYYAGHGLYDKDSEGGYWLPSAAKLKNRATWC